MYELPNAHLCPWLSTYILGIEPQRPKPVKYRATRREMDSENQITEQHELGGVNGRNPQPSDKSEALLSMYLERADDVDNNFTERWKKECGAMLTFTGLFSAALAALLAISVSDLRQNSQDTTAIYVANIYHLLANVTTSQAIVLPTPLDPPQFSPTRSAVWVNAIWFLSLVMSLTDALLAVLIQQWVESYLRATQQRQSPQDRVKTREFCSRGLKKSSISSIVRAVPILIHVSLFLFFIGLLIWLININSVVYLPTVAWLGLCAGGYAYVTLMPILHHESPYHSPLSLLIRRCKIFVQVLFTQPSEVFRHLASSSQATPRSHRHSQLSVSMHDAKLNAARELPLDINYEAFWWTFESLKQDSELERFYDAVPDLCASYVESLRGFIDPNKRELSTGLVGLMDRTFSSNLVAESVKQQRIKICMKAASATGEALLGHWYFLCRVLRGDWPGFLGSVPFGRFVQNWQSSADNTTNLCIQFVASAIIARAPARDEPWAQLVRNHLGQSESTFQDYLVRGHTILLANLNCMVSHIAQFDPQVVSQEAYDLTVQSLGVLESICKFDVQGTSLELQHEFCHLWNQLVRNQPVQNAANPPTNPPTRDLTVITLNHICKVHNALHGRTGPLAHAGASTAPHVECIGDGQGTIQSDPISSIDNTTSGPTGNADNFAVSISQHHRFQVTAHLASSRGNPQVVTHIATSAAVPVSAPAPDEHTHAIVQQSSSNIPDASQTSPPLSDVRTLDRQVPQSLPAALPVQVNSDVSG